jgi:hypothetical protein
MMARTQWLPIRELAKAELLAKGRVLPVSATASSVATN